MNWHEHEVQDIFQELATSEAGLAPTAAAHRLANTALTAEPKKIESVR